MSETLSNSMKLLEEINQHMAVVSQKRRPFPSGSSQSYFPQAVCRLPLISWADFLFRSQMHQGTPQTRLKRLLVFSKIYPIQFFRAQMVLFLQETQPFMTQDSAVPGPQINPWPTKEAVKSSQATRKAL